MFLAADNQGVSRELMKVGGLLPITFRGATYNIPVSVWVPAEYPTRPATPYVTPTQGATPNCPLFVSPVSLSYAMQIWTW